jgi:hypothetical protein
MKLFLILLTIFSLSSCQVKQQDGSDTLVSGNNTVQNKFTAKTITAGSYNNGDNIDIKLTFPFPVAVTGTPRLELDVGGTTEYADYFAGTATTQITFRYPVTIGDDTDGIVINPIIDLNGGTLKFTANATVNDCNTTFVPANTTNVKVDNTPPTILSYTHSLPNVYQLSQNISVTVLYDENVIVTGTPRIELDVGGTTKYLNYASGTGTTSLVFTTTVSSGNKDLDGVELNGISSLNGGTLLDAGGNVADFTFTNDPLTNVFVHDVPTKVNSITPSANATYGFGEDISFTLVFNNAITVTGTPRIAITLTSGTVYADYVSGSGSTSLVFTYTVGGGDTDANGITVTSPIDLNSGTLVDSNSDPVLLLTFTAPTTTNVRVDGVVPSISSITPPANATYLLAQNMNFTANFSEAVTVTGTPTLDLDIGGSIVSASYISGSGTTALLFRYIPQAGDFDSDGIELGTITGTIKDANGNDADVTVPVTNTASIDVDAVVPTIASVAAPADDTYLVAEAMDFVVTFTKLVTVTGTPRIAFSTTDGTKYATYLSGSGTNTWTFRYTVASNVYDYNGITITSPIELNGGTIKDSLNYNSTLTFTPPVTTGVMVDASPAIISSVSVPTSRTYGNGENLNFTVAFTKAVTINPTSGTRPRIAITLTSGTVYADYQSGSGTQNIVFRHTIVGGEADANGIVLVSPINLNTGTIKDSNTIDATLTYTPPTTSGILIDSVSPVISSVSAPANSTYLAGQNLNFTVDFNEEVIITGSPRLTLNVGGSTKYATYVNNSGSTGGTCGGNLNCGTSFLFRYTVSANEYDSDGIAITASIALNGGTIQDPATNNAVLTFSAPVVSSIFVDAVIGAISSVTPPTNGLYSNTQQLNFNVVFNKVMTVTGTPRIHLTLGAGTVHANYVSCSTTANPDPVPDNSTCIFRYTVTANDFDMNGLAVGNSNTIDLNSGNIADALSITPDLVLPAINLTSVHATYAGLGGWWDITDATTVTTVFNTPNYETSAWNDKSGNARHLSQATALNRLWYLSSGFGSQNRPYLLNQTSDFMSLASNITNIKYIIMIFRTPATIVAAPIFATNTTNVMGLTTGGTGRLQFNTNAKWKVNGAALSGTAATASTNGDVTTNTCYVASSEYTTAQTPATQRIGSTAFLGQIAEVLVFTSAVTLDNTKLTAVHNYLNAKYGCY